MTPPTPLVGEGDHSDCIADALPGASGIRREVFSGRKRIERYVQSKRRLAFNNDDVFRRYPELGG